MHVARWGGRGEVHTGFWWENLRETDHSEDRGFRWEDNINTDLQDRGFKWEDNINTDLQDVGWWDMDWINLAQNRDRGRAVVITVTYFRVP